jgi:amino acid adenylation domain-containing protein
MTATLLWQLLTHSRRHFPEKVAVIDGERTLRYAELDDQSSRFADKLHTHGVGVGARVGIYLDKSIEALVAIFGVLKAGAAYVPLDVQSPINRVALIVTDCQLAAVVGTSERLKALPAVLTEPPRRMIAIDECDLSTVQPYMTQTATERDLAYILYTSGSTGQPKGVMIDHRAALSFVHWGVAYFRLSDADRLSSHAPLHFDLSIFDIFAAIAVGATVALVPPMLAIFPYSLAAWIAATGITVWYSVPSALTQLVLHGELASHDLSALRAILFAGEVFHNQHLARLQQLIPQATYHNLYGPTETNVCTVYDVPRISPERTEPVPIGRPCAYCDVYLVNAAGERITANHERGEVVVRGPSLMRGYWNAATQTAQVLTTDPHTGEPCYHTGDFAYRDESGIFVFVGRKDGMVKSRGYRIELGEIEAVAYRHPAVAEAAVVPVPDEEIGHSLVLYIALRTGCCVGEQELFAHYQLQLPTYMHPKDIVFLASLPKTSTGKTDRTQLSIRSHAYGTTNDENKAAARQQAATY